MIDLAILDKAVNDVHLETCPNRSQHMDWLLKTIDICRDIGLLTEERRQEYLHVLRFSGTT